MPPSSFHEMRPSPYEMTHAAPGAAWLAEPVQKAPDATGETAGSMAGVARS